MLAKQAVTNAVIEGYNTDHTQLLPREDVALIVWGDKITGNISGPLRFHASKAVARKYHMNQQKRGKWTQEQFKEVDWEHLDLALKSKADNYKIWPSKQTSGFCDTRAQVGLYSGDKFPDKRCPNCGARETDAHLMRCLDKNRMQLLINTVEELEKWMEFDGKTDPELIYWIPKIPPNARRQTFLPTRIHVGEYALSCRESGQNWLALLYQGLHLYPLLRHPALPPLKGQQLPQRIGPDQTVHFQTPPTDTLPIDLPQYFPP